VVHPPKPGLNADQCAVNASARVSQNGVQPGARSNPLIGSGQRRAVLEAARQQAPTPKKATPKATPKPLTPTSYGLQGGQTSCKVLTAGKFLIHWRVRLLPCEVRMMSWE
jgi:hypothetical protein